MPAEKTQAICLRINSKLIEHLNEKSREKHCSVPEYIRHLIKKDSLSNEVGDKELSVLNKASNEIADALFLKISKFINEHEKTVRNKMETTNKNLDQIINALNILLKKK